MSQEMKTKTLTLFGARGGDLDLVIPGEAITELIMLPSGFPMVTFKTPDGDFARVGGFPFRFDLEPPPMVQGIGAMPKLPRVS